jgi:hypothetical protein
MSQRICSGSFIFKTAACTSSLVLSQDSFGA